MTHSQPASVVLVAYSNMDQNHAPALELEHHSCSSISCSFMDSCSTLGSALGSSYSMSFTVNTSASHGSNSLLGILKPEGVSPRVGGKATRRASLTGSTASSKPGGKTTRRASIAGSVCTDCEDKRLSIQLAKRKKSLVRSCRSFDQTCPNPNFVHKPRATKMIPRRHKSTGTHCQETLVQDEIPCMETLLNQLPIAADSVVTTPSRWDTQSGNSRRSSSPAIRPSRHDSFSELSEDDPSEIEETPLPKVLLLQQLNLPEV